MIKNISKFILSAVCGLLFNTAYSQVNISGPSCVIPGTIYEYRITGVWDSLSLMHVCVNGGIIADTSISGSCSDDGPPLSAVLVVWSDTSQASLMVVFSGGYSSLTVTTTAPLVAGVIDSASLEQSFYDSLSIPGVIHCSAGDGGSCSPSYSYQWRRSEDAMVWEDIEGETSQDLTFTQAATKTFYYHRRINENNSNTTGYSNTAVVNVIVPQMNGSQ